MAESTQAAKLADEIRAVARQAHTEEDLRVGVEHVLAGVREELGIQSRYERSYSGAVDVLGGRGGSSDAVYGHVVIEYKRPGRLAQKGGMQETVYGRKGPGGQRGGLVQYMEAEAAREGGEREKALRRIMGVGLDGERILFVRYRGEGRRGAQTTPPLTTAQLALFEVEAVPGEFQVLGPYVISEEAIDRFLLYLRALRRRPLTPEALAEEFGPKGGIAGKMVNTLYERLLDAVTKPDNPYPKAEVFFAEWDRIFGIVYGQDIGKARKDVQDLARLYGLTGREDLKLLLFAVHTYYALLMKLLAAELAALQRGSLVSSVVADLPSIPPEELRERLTDLENGGLFAKLGIRNFLEGDFFGWYLTAWDKDLEESIREMARALSEYEPATGSLQPEATKDLLKRLYQYLIPRELRHDLGEYYTPDWLAELVLNEVGYDGNVDRRLLDPACGSGTFLVLAIRRAREYAEEKLLEPRETAERILANIQGFDLNPLAVIAARTNYLLALEGLPRGQIEIPVYLCDSILTPAREAEKRPVEHQRDIPVPSVVGDFWIPEEVVERGQIAVLAGLLEECVEWGRTTEEFLERCRRQLEPREELSEGALRTLYEKVLGLKEEKKNGIWARIVKNAFAPVFAGQFDYVVGNPPWVNWESLADEYREATKDLWQRYGLFSLRGHAARLGGGKKDVAMLMLYAAMDSYLESEGKLGFVITQTVFKTKGAGDGFRRFRLGEEGAFLKVESAQDLTRLQPFEGATNRTATVTLSKGRETTYPVRYTLWKKHSPGRIGTELALAEVEVRCERVELAAQPIVPEEPTSPWLTASPVALAALRKVIGASPYYKAHAGACTWANGVYWVRVLERRADGLLMVENLHDEGKTKVKRVWELVESDLVYPLLRGRDVGRWRAEPSAYILMVQDPEERTGYDEGCKTPGTMYQ